MATLRFGSLDYQHATWLSNNRMADPVTGSDSDGFLLAALLGGFHTNFDGCTSEMTNTITGVTAGGAGEIAIQGMTTSGRVVVTLDEDASGALVLSHVVPGANKITIYTKDVLSVAVDGGVAVIGDGINVAIQVLSYSSTIDASALSNPPINGFTGTARIIGGVNQALYMHAAPNTVTPANAIYGATAGFVGGRSSFAMVCVDEDITPSNIGFSQKDRYCIPAASSFRYVADITSWSNRSTVATKAKAQIGVMAARHANYELLMSAGPQAASASAIYVEFAANTMKLYFGTTASNVVQIPTTLTSFSIRIEYRAGRGVYLYLNNKKVATIQTTTSTTAMQVFGRAGHLVAYDAANSAPITFAVDAVSLAIDKG